MVRSFSTVRDCVQRHRCLKKGIKKKALRTERKGKMTIFTRKTMSHRKREKANNVIFTLPQLLLGKLR